MRKRIQPDKHQGIRRLSSRRMGDEIGILHLLENSLNHLAAILLDFGNELISGPQSARKERETHNGTSHNCNDAGEEEQFDKCRTTAVKTHPLHGGESSARCAGNTGLFLPECLPLYFDWIMPTLSRIVLFFTGVLVFLFICIIVWRQKLQTEKVYSEAALIFDTCGYADQATCLSDVSCAAPGPYSPKTCYRSESNGWCCQRGCTIENVCGDDQITGSEECDFGGLCDGGGMHGLSCRTIN